MVRLCAGPSSFFRIDHATHNQARWIQPLQTSKKNTAKARKEAAHKTGLKKTAKLVSDEGKEQSCKAKRLK
jgi:hypothetical protein